jgi:hypothetical protein
MRLRPGSRAALASLALAALAGGAGCRERLTSPAECPELCPGGNSEVFDLVLNPLPGSDSSYPGFVTANSAVNLLASTGPVLGEQRAVIRFVERPDSLAVRDTMRAYTVDSVLISLNLIARDTLTDGLSILVYRVSPTVNTATTFAELEPQLTDANLIDIIPVPDSINSGRIQTLLQGDELARVVLPPGTGGILALGITLTANQPTGVRLGASGAATFLTYTTVDVPDTAVAIRKQSISRAGEFTSYVSQAEPAIDTTLLTVGGQPSSRALLRFDLPEPIEDSATIVRATLELIPRTAIVGLPTDPAVLSAAAVLADLGVKSPVVTPDEDLTFIARDTISPGTADTVRLDVTRLVQLWQSSVERPEAIFLSLLPEAASFMRAEFGSTRRPEIGAPRLRVTYLRSFPFENP